MSSPERRQALAEQFEREQQERRLEEARKEALTMWQRIEEVASFEDVKDVLHRIAEHMGLEE